MGQSTIADPQSISIADAGGYYATDNVEAALQEAGLFTTTHDASVTAHPDIRATLDNHTTQLAQTASLAYLNEKTGYGVISGLGVTQQTVPDMTVRVATGVIWMSNGDRWEPTANNALAITAAAATKRRDIVYINSAGTIAYLAGTAATLGHRTYTITTNAVAGDTFIVNGVTFTAVSAGATGAQFNVGATADDTAANLAAVIGAHASFSPYYAVTASTNIITILQKVAVDGAYTPTVRTGTGTIAVTNTLVATSVAAIRPTTPTGGQQIAHIYVAAGDTAINTDDISDLRKNLWTEPYIKPTLLNGATEPDAAKPIGYYKDVNNVVRMIGIIYAPAGGVAVSFKMPAGYRPRQQIAVSCSTTAGGATNVIAIAGGDIYCGSTAYAVTVDLSGFTYRAD